MGVSFHFADPLHPSNDKPIMEFLKIDGCKLTLPQNRWVQLHPLHLSNDATEKYIEIYKNTRKYPLRGYILGSGAPGTPGVNP